MHDPLSFAHEIRYPWKKYRHPKNDFEKTYRESFITIWHEDPERDGTDDSCDWFGIKRTRANGWYPAILDTYNSLTEDQRRVIDFIWFNFVHQLRRPWYKHPKWHVWHWRIQVHPWQIFRRWFFSRCAGCGKRFTWGYSPFSAGWKSPKTRWFRSEVGSYHDACYPGFAGIDPAAEGTEKTTAWRSEDGKVVDSDNRPTEVGQVDLGKGTVLSNS